MSAILLNGKEMEKELLVSQIERCNALKAQGVQPMLSVIIVGEDPASEIYVRNKSRMCDNIGILSQTIRMPADITQEALEAEIDRLNADDAVTGILVQLPLPRHLNENQALAKILPEKDVDGFHPVNAGKLFLGEEAPAACTPAGCMELLRRTGISLNGKRAVVLGRSNIVGKPMAAMLLQANCTVTVCHSKTENLSAITREADILVAAIGKPKFVTAEMVKSAAVVLDVGINRLADGTLCGDVDTDDVARVASYITPVPGGVGPMTIAMLLVNTVKAAEKYAE